MEVIKFIPGAKVSELIGAVWYILQYAAQELLVRILVLRRLWSYPMLFPGPC